MTKKRKWNKNAIRRKEIMKERNNKGKKEARNEERIQRMKARETTGKINWN